MVLAKCRQDVPVYYKYQNSGGIAGVGSCLLMTTCPHYICSVWSCQRCLSVVLTLQVIPPPPSPPPPSPPPPTTTTNQLTHITNDKPQITDGSTLLCKCADVRDWNAMPWRGHRWTSFPRISLNPYLIWAICHKTLTRIKAVLDRIPLLNYLLGWPRLRSL